MNVREVGFRSANEPTVRRSRSIPYFYGPTVEFEGSRHHIINDVEKPLPYFGSRIRCALPLDRISAVKKSESTTDRIRGGTGIIPGTESRVCYLGFDTGPGWV